MCYLETMFTLLFLLQIILWSTTVLAGTALHLDLESTFWSQFVTPQATYPAESHGVSWGGDWLFKVLGKTASLGGRIHGSQTSYRIGPLVREGVAMHLMALAHVSFIKENGYTIQGYGGILPWAQLSVLSRETSTVNGVFLERQTLATYRDAFGLQLGAQLEKEIEFWIFKNQHPLLLGGGLGLRLVQFGRVETQAVSTQPDGNGSNSQTKTFQLRSLLFVGSLGTLL